LAARAGQPVERACAQPSTASAARSASRSTRLRARRPRVATDTLGKKPLSRKIDDSYDLQADWCAERMLQSAGPCASPIGPPDDLHADALAPVEGRARELPARRQFPSRDVVRSQPPAAQAGVRRLLAVHQRCLFVDELATKVGSARVVRRRGSSGSLGRSCAAELRRMNLAGAGFGRPGAHCPRSGGGDRDDLMAAPRRRAHLLSSSPTDPPRSANVTVSVNGPCHLEIVRKPRRRTSATWVGDERDLDLGGCPADGPLTGSRRQPAGPESRTVPRLGAARPRCNRAGKSTK